jgi:hypothetical protein
MFRNLMNRWIKKSVATKKTICKPDRLSMLQLEDRVTPTVTFASTTSSSSGGSEPWSVATGDFNNDGKLDLAVANFASSGVAIRLGDGTGGFGAANIYSSGGSGPSFLALGDFNNDGKLDLAVTNLNSNNVAIRLGDGAGGLGTVSTYFSGGGQPWSIAMGDINNDGKLDLVTANYADNNIGILLGNGAGGFNGPITSFTFNTGPRSVAVGDLNNDGKLDLAVTHAVSNNVAVFAGLGNGQFIFISTYSTGGSFPVSVTVNDFNNDGKLDLAVANESSNNVGIRLGNGFTGLTTLSSGGASPFSTAAGDFNNDGKLDLALTNFNSNNVAVSLGNGSGGFSTPSTFSSGGSVPWSVAVGDFNADGKQDLVTVSRSSNSIGVLLNTTTPVASLVATLSSGKLTIIDANGSKNNAITLSVSGSNLVVTDTSGEIFSNTGTNTYTVPLTSITGSITVNSMGGNDTLTVNHSGGVITNPINYNGGVSGFDTLVVTGGSFATGNFVYTGVDSGTIGLTGAGLISYSGLEPIDTTGSTIANLVFTLPAGPSTATLANDGANLKLSASAFEDTTFANPTGSITINRGNAADTLSINNASNLTAALTVGTVANPFNSVSITGGALNLGLNPASIKSQTISVASPLTAGTVDLKGTTSVSVMANITGGSGGVTIVGGGSSTGNTVGVTVSGATISTTNNGNVSVTGTGGVNSGNNHGVHVMNAGQISASGSGTVSVTGNGGSGSGGNNFGVYVQNAGSITSGGSGTVTVTGKGSTIAGVVNLGVLVRGTNSQITSSGGAVLVQGTGGGFGGTFSNYGVLLDDGGVITSAGTGVGATVTVTGQGGNTTGSENFGVYVLGPNSQITSSGGAVLVQGTGGGSVGPQTSSSNYGVYVASGGVITSAGAGVGATVTVTGTGGSTVGNANLGVFVTGNNSQITSSGGAVNVIGSGGGVGGSSSNYGVYVSSGGVITSTDAGVGATVTVTGTGGSTAGSGNLGVFVTGNNSQITSSGGAVIVTGTGGSGSSGSTYGVHVTSAGVITSAGTGATVTVTGTGGNTSGVANTGVYLFGSNSRITSSGGAVSVTATGNTNANPAEALRLESSGAVTSGSGAPITITADSVNLLTGTSINSGMGTTTIRPRTAGTNINLGGADVLSGSPLTLGLTSAELNQITAGKLVIGRNDISTGVVIVNSAVNPTNANALEVISARNIVVGANLTGGSGGLTLSANQQATPTSGNFIGIEILTGKAVNTIGGGNVLLQGRGGNTGSLNEGVRVLGSVSGTGTVTVQGTGGLSSSSSIYGVLVSGTNAQISSSGGAVLVQGTGGGSGSSGFNHGVFVQSAGVITAGDSGTVTVEGQSGNTTGTGLFNYGVYITDSGSQITSAGGSVSVSGTGSVGGGNYGVFVFNSGSITSGGTGAVEVTGGAGSGFGGFGVLLSGSESRITSLSGSVLVTVQAGNRLSIENNASVISNAGNPITLTADGVGIISGGSINSGTGTTTIRPRTAGTLINLGGVDVLSGSPLALGLTDAELDQVVAANLIIGKSDAGSLSVSNSVTRNTATNLQLVTGGDLIVNSSVNTTGGTLSLQAGGTVQPLFTGTEITAATLTFATGTKLRFAINGATADTHYSVLRVNGAVDLTGAELELHGAYVPGVADDFTLIDNDGTEAIAGTFNGLAEGALVDLNGRSYAISYVGGDGNDAVLSPTITGFDVQRGQTQRSFIRHLDVDLSSNSLATALLGSGRVRLLRYNLDGSGPGVSVNLAGRLSVNGARLSIDFGSGGIGGNRNSNIGDGYYVLEFDLNGDSTYDSDLSFYRLLGDTDGNRTVNTTDLSNIETAISLSQYDPDLDINGDGVVNGIDRTITLRHRGRSIGSSLHLDD